MIYVDPISVYTVDILVLLELWYEYGITCVVVLKFVFWQDVIANNCSKLLVFVLVTQDHATLHIKAK